MEKKNNTLLITIIIILVLLVVSLGGYILYDKLLKEEKTTVTDKGERQEIEQGVQKQDEDNDDNDNCLQAATVKCYGTYYVNGDINQGVYNLKEDGTYSVENKEETGVFTINENTITFIQMKHTVGPRDQDPYFNDGVSYLITDDCSKISLTSPGSETTAYLQKAN